MNIIEEKFGNRNGNDRLKEIFEAGVSGEMNYAEFKKTVEDFFTVF